MNDPYSVLGVDRNATDDEIKKAYRALCRKYHPDKNPGNEKAEEMFKIVQEAYQQVMNERKNGTSSQGNFAGGAYGGYQYGSGASSGYSGSSESNLRYQAAANYINSGHYREAINVLMSMKERDAMWYYLSACANAGIGNNYAAMEQARTAVSMDPNNPEYQRLLMALQGGGMRYQNMQSQYGRGSGSNSSACLSCCAANILLNLCCSPCC